MRLIKQTPAGQLYSVAAGETVSVALTLSQGAATSTLNGQTKTAPFQTPAAQTGGSHVVDVLFAAAQHETCQVAFTGSGGGSGGETLLTTPMDPVPTGTYEFKTDATGLAGAMAVGALPAVKKAAKKAAKKATKKAAKKATKKAVKKGVS